MQFDLLPSRETIDQAMEGLRQRGITPVYAAGRQEALDQVKALIPAGASVMTGASVTLEEIGFVDLLVGGDHPWHNLKNDIFAEKDPAKMLHLRRLSSVCDYFLGSIHALTEDGECLIASASGSQLPAYAFSAAHVIWVVGAHKIVPDREAAFQRVSEYVFPREDARMKSTGASGSSINKQLLFSREAIPGRMTLVLVSEKLGY